MTDATRDDPPAPAQGPGTGRMGRRRRAGSAGGGPDPVPGPAPTRTGRWRQGAGTWRVFLLAQKGRPDPEAGSDAFRLGTAVVAVCSAGSPPGPLECRARDRHHAGLAAQRPPLAGGVDLVDRVGRPARAGRAGHRSVPQVDGVRDVALSVSVPGCSASCRRWCWAPTGPTAQRSLSAIDLAFPVARVRPRGGGDGRAAVLSACSSGASTWR